MHGPLHSPLLRGGSRVEHDARPSPWRSFGMAQRANPNPKEIFTWHATPPQPLLPNPKPPILWHGMSPARAQILLAQSWRKLDAQGQKGHDASDGGYPARWSHRSAQTHRQCQPRGARMSAPTHLHADLERDQDHGRL
jgi:hypothetical protein